MPYHLTIFGESPCSRILGNIPKIQNGAHALRELTIIYLGMQIPTNFNFPNISLQKLQPIDGPPLFYMQLLMRMDSNGLRLDGVELDLLRAIPQVLC